MLEGLDQSVSEKQRDELADLLILYGHIFSRNSLDLGVTSLAQHSIALTDDKPIREPNRKQPVYIREAIQREVDSLEEQGIIQ